MAETTVRRRLNGLSDTEIEAFGYYLLGDMEALDLAEIVISFTHGWDDLIDCDKEVSDHLINEAFFSGVIELQKNRFFEAHKAELLPLLEQGVYDWFDSNALLEEGNLPAAFVLRTSIMSMIIRCAFILGGQEWGRKASLAIRRYTLDDFEEFVKEHGGSHGLGWWKQQGQAETDGPGTCAS